MTIEEIAVIQNLLLVGIVEELKIPSEIIGDLIKVAIKNHRNENSIESFEMFKKIVISINEKEKNVIVN